MTDIIKKILNFKIFKELETPYKENDFPIKLTWIDSSLFSFFIKYLSNNIKKDILIIEKNNSSLLSLQNDLQALGINPIVIPKLGDAYELFDSNSDREDKIYSFLENRKDSKPSIVITELCSVLQPIKNILLKDDFVLKLNKEYEKSSIIEKLISLGYEKTNKVFQELEFSFQGDILDIFVTSNNFPYRIKFDFNEIVEIKEFEVIDHTSLNNTHKELIIENNKRNIWDLDILLALENEFKNMSEIDYETQKRNTI